MIPKKPDHIESTLDTFVRWLSDGETWIGIFENQDLGHYDMGRRIALPFDNTKYDAAVIGQTRAPDHRSIGLGWRYVLIEISRDARLAVHSMEKGGDIEQHRQRR